ncbi:hypothetical protein VTJ04DRAFT_430 [Mycothermus thermophilus]|uniref:uncharacterized protein n=1 Tax=Humicola insolens TaxID=85995 RepID=UPI0037449C05
MRTRFIVMESQQQQKSRHALPSVNPPRNATSELTPNFEPRTRISNLEPCPSFSIIPFFLIILFVIMMEKRKPPSRALNLPIPHPSIQKQTGNMPLITKCISMYIHHVHHHRKSSSSPLPLCIINQPTQPPKFRGIYQFELTGQVKSEIGGRDGRAGLKKRKVNKKKEKKTTPPLKNAPTLAMLNVHPKRTRPLFPLSCLPKNSTYVLETKTNRERGRQPKGSKKRGKQKRARKKGR